MNDPKDLARRIENQREQLANANALIKRLQNEAGRPVKTFCLAFHNANQTGKSVALKMLNVIENAQDDQELHMAIHTIEDALNAGRNKKGK